MSSNHLQSLGRRILSEANDLKRTPAAMADEIGIKVKTIEAVIDGRADYPTVRNVLDRMVETYPISLANLWVEKDDTYHGVLVMSATETAASARIFDRINRQGIETPYYEYRDTSMSRTAPFRPEWIKELRVVSDDDPENPDVAYNNGHLMHQCTFFIGPVNFYWETGGKRHCARMNTGDSNYITPFVPHSFASPDPNHLGLIIAVTYNGMVRSSLQEFHHIGPNAADVLAGSTSDPLTAFNAKLHRYLAAESLSVNAFATRLVDAGLEMEAVNEIASAERLPLAHELAAIAQILYLRPEDLLQTTLAENEKVVVNFAKDGSGRPFPDVSRPAYQLRELARSAHQPGLRGVDVTVLTDAPQENTDFCHGLHEYIYNYGTAPVILFWSEGYQTILGSGDSAYVRPMVAHGFLRCPGEDQGELAVVRVPGGLTDRILEEFATYPTDRRSRVCGETSKWF